MFHFGYLTATKILSSTVFSFPLYSYMVDAADREKIEASRNELHNLLDKPQLQGIPVRGRLQLLDQKLLMFQPVPDLSLWFLLV